jgi:hypothetical protein
MCVYDRERWGQVYGEVRVEADRVDVEEGDECGACVGGELCEDFGTDGCGRDDEGVWFQSVRLRYP